MKFDYDPAKLMSGLGQFLQGCLEQVWGWILPQCRANPLIVLLAALVIFWLAVRFLRRRLRIL